MLKLRIVLVIISLVPSLSEAQMVPQNVLTRVFNLRMGSQTATGFTIEVDNRQYLVTARHVINASPTATEIELFHDAGWMKVPFRPITIEPTMVDIAVLALDRQVSDVLPVKNGTRQDYFLSQEVFFVGYPFGLFINGKALNRGYPLPFVKHGIIAATASGDGEPFVVDGINNPGFSGGPIVVGGSSPIVIGVVSAYRFNSEPVYQQEQQTPLTVRSNTGLLIGYGIEYAIEAIKKNPIGFVVQ